MRRGTSSELRRSLAAISAVAFALFVCLWLEGCTTLSVSRPIPVVRRGEFASRLSLRRPSEAASMNLYARGIDPKLPFNAVVIADALDERALNETIDDRLTRAEIHAQVGRGFQPIRRAEALRHDYIAAVLASSIVHQSAPLSAATLDRAIAIHNEALTRFLSRSGGRNLELDPAWQSELAALEIPVALRRDALVWDPNRIGSIRLCEDYIVSGVRTPIRTLGLGVPVFGVRDLRPIDPRTAAGEGEESLYPPIQVYPATAILRSGPSGGTPVLEFHDPLRFDAVSTGARTIPLASDLSTPLAFHFVAGRLFIAEQISMFRPEALKIRSGLHLIHPYEPGKIPVIFIHGLWSSPRAFFQTLNELRGDPAIRSRYQFWFYMYPSGDPFIHTAAMFRDALVDMRAKLDPGGRDAALDRIVLVGHSMGGLLSKMTVQESGNALWKVIAKRPLESMNLSDPEHRKTLEKVFMYHPNPAVRRIVFIATPHRGTRMGDNVVGRVVSSLIKSPDELVAVRRDLFENNDPAVFTPQARKRVSSSIDILKYNNPMIDAVEEAGIAPWVIYHTIVGKLGPGPLETSTDGVVSYKSAHLDGAASELVVPTNHLCQQDPRTIVELKRILAEHLRVFEDESALRIGGGREKSAATGPTKTSSNNDLLRR